MYCHSREGGNPVIDCERSELEIANHVCNKIRNSCSLDSHFRGNDTTVFSSEVCEIAKMRTRQPKIKTQNTGKMPPTVVKPGWRFFSVIRKQKKPHLPCLQYQNYICNPPGKKPSKFLSETS